MRSKSDFWLTLHQLTRDLEREGSTASDRAHSVCEILNALSPDTRSVYLGNLQMVLSTLQEVHTNCHRDAQG